MLVGNLDVYRAYHRRAHRYAETKPETSNGGIVKTFTWTVKITVAERWVADGLVLTEQRVHNAIVTRYPHVRMSEVDVKVTCAPPDEDIAEAQGYPSVEAYRRSK